MVINPETAIECSTCHYNFPTSGWEKYLAVRRDLVENGLAALVGEELQLSTVAREDDPMEKYRHSLNRIGWSGGSSKVDFTEDSRDSADKAAKKRLVVLLLLFFVLLGGALYYSLFYQPAPPPPPPKPPAKPVKR
jgi:hypothetical protein